MAPDFCSLGPTGISGCLPITPSPTKLGTAALYGVTVHTPSTPELYSALNLSYNCRLAKSCIDSNGMKRDKIKLQNKHKKTFSVIFPLFFVLLLRSSPSEPAMMTTSRRHGTAGQTGWCTHSRFLLQTGHLNLLLMIGGNIYKKKHIVPYFQLLKNK